jgi:hypothetical protein
MRTIAKKFFLRALSGRAKRRELENLFLYPTPEDKKVDREARRQWEALEAKQAKRKEDA